MPLVLIDYNFLDITEISTLVSRQKNFLKISGCTYTRLHLLM